MEYQHFNKNDIYNVTVSNQNNNFIKSDDIEKCTNSFSNGLRNRDVKTGKITITNENSNHFLINSEQLPKGLVLTRL